MNVNISLAEDIIKACCILHNYSRSRDGYRFEETFTLNGFRHLHIDSESRGTSAAISVRDKFANFMTATKANYHGSIVPFDFLYALLKNCYF